MRRPRSVAEYQELLQEQLQAVKEMTGTVEELLGFAKWDAASWKPPVLRAPAPPSLSACLAPSRRPPPNNFVTEKLPSR